MECFWQPSYGNEIKELKIQISIELFQDISIFVSQQGEQIDNIETNINNSLSHVTKANVELRKTEKYQSKRRKKCLYFSCIIGLSIIIVVILVIVLIVS